VYPGVRRAFYFGCQSAVDEMVQKGKGEAAHFALTNPSSAVEWKLTMGKTLAQKPSTREVTLKIIRALTGQANILTIPREFINYTKSLKCGLFLSQLLYWSDRVKRADGFIYKTYDEWDKEIHLSEYDVRKAVKVLKSKGILETKLKKANGSPTVHYRLDLNRFSESFMNYLQEEKSKNSENQAVETEESLTETTTETTTVKKRESADALTHPQILQTNEPCSLTVKDDCNDGVDSTVNDGADDRVTNAGMIPDSKPIAAKSPATPARAVPLPEGFWPTDGMILRAGMEHPYTEITKSTQKFINYHRAKGTKFVNWNAAWNNWIIDERKTLDIFSPDVQGDSERDKIYIRVTKNAMKMIGKFMESSLAVSLDELVGAMNDPELRPFLSDILDGLWVKGELGKPAEGYYCRNEYLTDPDYENKVNSWLTAKGVEILVYDSENYAPLREALEWYGQDEEDFKEQHLGKMFPPDTVISDSLFDEPEFHTRYITDVLDGTITPHPRDYYHYAIYAE
jgi:hypothetical protein